MNQRSSSQEEALSEQNLSKLLQQAKSAPEFSDAAKERIWQVLRAEHKQVTAPKTSRYGRVLIALAASLLAVIGLSWWMSPPELSREGKTQIKPETSRYTLRDGSTILVHQGSFIEDAAPRSLTVQRGAAIIDARPGASPLFINTRAGKVSISEGRFLLDLRDEEPIIVSLRGALSIETIKGAGSLHTGESVSISAKGDLTRRPLQRTSTFAYWARPWLSEDNMRIEQTPDLLMARLPDGQSSGHTLPLRDFVVDVYVEDQVARVAIDQTFFNDSASQLEALYTFSLPVNAAISRLAMYVDGVRMEAGIAERQRARDIYESIVSKQRDPALLEQLQGNLFQTRIFPLPPYQEKRILLSYTQPLQQIFDGYQLVVHLPKRAQPSDHVRYQARIKGGAGLSITSASHAIWVQAEGNDALVSFEASDYTLERDLLLQVQGLDESSVKTREFRDDKSRYYSSTFIPALPRESAFEPRRWIILNDVSASRSKLLRRTQSFIIERLLKEFDPQDSFSILSFDSLVRAFEERSSLVKDAELAKILAHLKSQEGAGTTELELAMREALKLLETNPSYPPRAGRDQSPSGLGAEQRPYIIYLGDGDLGLDTETRLATLEEMVAGRATVISVGVGSPCNATVLASLAEKTNGVFTTINPTEDITWRVFDLIATLNTTRLKEAKVTLLGEDGAALSGGSTYLSAATINAGEALTVISALKETPSAMRLEGELKGQPWSQTIQLPAPEEGASYLPRLWAQKRIESLLQNGAAANQAEITALGTEHFLVTPFTSLLVLESDEMYQEYKVNRGSEDDWARYQSPGTINVRTERARTPTQMALDDEITPLSAESFELYPSDVELRAEKALIDFQGSLAHDKALSSDLEPTESISSDGKFATPKSKNASDEVIRFSLGNGTSDANEGLVDLPVKIGNFYDAGSNVDYVRWVNLVGLLIANDLELSESSGRSFAVNGKQSADVFIADGYQKRSVFGDEIFNRVGWAMINRHQAQSYEGSYFLSAEEQYVSNQRRSYSMSGVSHEYVSEASIDPLNFVPGLHLSRFDKEKKSLLGVGSIDARSAQLLQRAQAQRTSRSLTAQDGTELELNIDGTFTLVRTLPSALREQVFYDGKTLYQLYEELGLATKRDAVGVAPLVNWDWAPFVAPTAEEAAARFEVTSPDESTILMKNPATRALIAALHFNTEGQLTSLERFVGSRSQELVFIYEDERLIVQSDAQQLIYQVRELAPFTMLIEESDWSMFALPAKSPEYWEGQLESLPIGSLEWSHAVRQLLLSNWSLHHTNANDEHLGSLHANGKLLISDVLFGASYLRHFSDGDVIARYFYTAEGNSSTEYAAFAKENPNTLLGMLASYRNLYRRDLSAGAYSAYQAETLPLLREFLSSYPRSPLRYSLVLSLSEGADETFAEALAGLWAQLATEPALREAATLQSIRLLGRCPINTPCYQEALRQAEAYMADMLQEGKAPLPGALLQDVFSKDPTQDARLQALWSAWEGAALKDLRLLDGLLSAQIPVRPSFVKELEEHLSGREGELLFAASLLYRSAQAESAFAMLKPLREKDSPLALYWSAVLSEEMGKTRDAANYLERYLSLAESRLSLPTSRRMNTKLYLLLSQLAKESQDDADMERALQAVARTRGQDDDSLDLSLFAGFSAIQRGAEAKRYLYSIIERNPNDPLAYQKVAEALRAADPKEAKEAYAQAFRVEPTNPGWLLEQARLACQLKRRDEAQSLNELILQREWQPRFFRVVNDASENKESLKKKTACQ